MTHPSKKNTNLPWTSKLLTRETWLESKKARLSLTWGIICKKKSWIWSILLIKWNIIIVTAHSWGQKQQNDATKLSRHAFDHLHVALYLHVARVFLSSDQWWLWPCQDRPRPPGLQWTWRWTTCGDQFQSPDVCTVHLHSYHTAARLGHEPPHPVFCQ